MKEWDSNNYRDNFSFVPKYGNDVINLITKPTGSTVVDLGCGNGTLTNALNEKGYRVIGIDSSLEMLELAKKTYPNLEFICENALTFKLEKKADVVFSNAVFHWIDKENQDKLIKNIYDNLNTSGELVCEFGGYKCAEKIHQSLDRNFKIRGLNYVKYFYFPKISEYTEILERNGFITEYAVLFDRPTAQKSDNGVIDWINMFVTEAFKGIDDKLQDEIKKDVQNELYDELYIDNKWYIDYVRIRIRARKE